MPYAGPGELPEQIREQLPETAQEVYLRAFNSAWDHYKGWDLARGDASRHETAERVGWAAVQNDYVQGDDGDWHRR